MWAGERGKEEIEGGGEDDPDATLIVDAVWKSVTCDGLLADSSR